MGKLGDTLRERRVSLGLSLDQVEQGTKIRSRLLAALEEGDYVKLPNSGYVRGYISSYARFLDLDPIPLLAMYKSETGAGRYHELNLPQVDEAVAPSGQQHAVPWKAAIVIVLVVALLSLSVWAVTRIWSGPEPTLPEPAPLTEPTSTPPADNEEATPAVEQSEKPAVKLEPFTVAIAVANDGASWLKVTVDGKKAYEGTLTGGQGKTFEAAKSATIVVGKPSAVTITRDGEPVEIPASDDTPTVRLKATPIE